MKPEFAILVLSCDNYAHLWPAFFQCFFKHFPDCDYPVYLGSNTKTFSHSRVTTLLSGHDVDWSSSYLKILGQISQQRVFVILEDCLVTSEISSKKFAQIINFMISSNASHIKYWPGLNLDSTSSNPDFSFLDKGAPYRVTVCGFWDKLYLERLLLPGENPWNFEIFGSYRSSYSSGFYSLRVPLFSYKNTLEKGFWFQNALEWAQQEGLDLGVSQKSNLSFVSTIKSRIQIVYFNCVRKIPWRFRLKIMNLLRKLLISY